jgi:heat shock protein HtpX
MASYFDEIARNRIKSLLLMAVFTAFFTAIIYIFVLLLGGGLIAVGIGFALVLVYAAVVYFVGDRAVLKFSKAKEADRKAYPVLYDIVEGLAAASQVPVPRIYIQDDPNPNAFATGRNRKASSIVVTRGLISSMNKEELEGVIAHEMSHIYNNDIQFMMIAVVFAGAIGLASIFLRGIFWFGGFGNNRNSGGGMLFLVALVVGVLAPIFALLIRLAISRRREYMADANGARLIRNPGALASALKKIQQYDASPKATPVRSANEMTASLYFSNPFKAKSVMGIFSTHPPIEERISRLEHMY